MREDLIKRIFYQYLHKLSNHTKLISPPKIRPKSASGPDFIIEGKAYECKGTKFNGKKLFSQLLSYGLQYSQIGLVIPYNALNFMLLWKLVAVEKFLRNSPHLEKSIEIYLIAPYEERNYAIYRWSSVRMLNSEIDSILYHLIPNFVNLPIEEKEKKVIGFLDAIETQIKEEFRKSTIDKAKNAKSIWEGALINLNRH
jgi:hypothetical protein